MPHSGGGGSHSGGSHSSSHSGVAEAIREAAEVHIAILILHSQEATLLSYIAVQEDRGLCILITRIIPKR